MDSSNRFSKPLSTTKINQDHQTTSTYYYSKFDLFDDSLNFFFLKYQIFKKILRLSLGETWHAYAKETLFREVDNNKVFISNDVVFNQALELWLELRKEVNLTLIDDCNSNNNNNNNGFEANKKFEDGNIYEIFELKFTEKFQSIFINYTCFKAVLQGFYATANKVWNNTIEEHDLNINLIKPTVFNEKNEGEIEEESNFQYIKNTLKSFTKSSSKKIIKPLLIASEKILDYFSVSKKFFKSPKEEEIIDIEREIDTDAKNFSNFQSNVQQEASSELLKIKMQNLSLSDSYEEGLTNMNKKRKLQEANDSNPRIELKKFTKRAEKLLNPTFVNYASDYIEKFMENSKEKWQVARGFVTNIIEVNYNLFSNIEMKLSSKANDLKNHIKIRFLQPAQTFYHHLMKVWLIFKTNDIYYEFSFQEYLEKVKISMGAYWSERYVMPTQVFFETLINEWNEIKVESENEENLRLFIKKVRLNLLNVWEENVVKKIENINLTNPTILKNNV